MTNTLALALQILIAVESNGDPTAFNAREQAAGILRIRPIVVKDVNRILGKEAYTDTDRWDPTKSIEMATIYLAHYGSAERLKHEPRILDYALLWCAGPDGVRQEPTKLMRDYIARVRVKALDFVKYMDAEQVKGTP